ncbi:hypothetical protein J5J86_12870 [Aquabacter sp. L1I39]|uniref:DUF6931 family protein n=1 Tax=Aquabacter sp. L1I39 TaxID=2820278 RepID=UPI001ADCD720|nr:hypothetical protein [Aquabacter sp. L1I39]QTL01710.1 hypothetical protein J5J86_12870 [Aquabacter sp. L1I39]
MEQIQRVALLPKLRFATAAQLAAVLPPDDDVQPLFMPRRSASDLFIALVEAGERVAAIRYLAVSLPRREAVWWACAVARHFPTPMTRPEEEDCWAAVESWVYEPGDAKRRAAYAPAQVLDFSTAAAYAALGVYWSGGSLAPPETALVIPPGDALTGSAVGASVILSCVPGPARDIAARHDTALTIGFDIANGGSGLVEIGERP